MLFIDLLQIRIDLFKMGGSVTLMVFKKLTLHGRRTAHFVTIVLGLLCSLSAQPYQWSCHYPNFGYYPYDGHAWEGLHDVKYVSYVPVDHIDGPVTATCGYPAAQPSIIVTKIYKGD